MTQWNTFKHNDIAILQSTYSVSAVKAVPKDPLKEPLFDKATAIEFRPLDNSQDSSLTLGQFLVGTEEGWIHLCNARLVEASKVMGWVGLGVALRVGLGSFLEMES